MKKLKAHAIGKINLCLEVLGRRNDGYHEVRSVIRSVDIKDEIYVEMSTDLNVACDSPNIQGEENIAFHAARLLQKIGDIKVGASIKNVKGIPIASGFGGGSSDAAAVLVLLNILWDLNLSNDSLKDIASEVGSDVPFFIEGGTAFVSGRGEIVRPIPCSQNSVFLLVSPDIKLENKTAEMYSLLTPLDFTKGGLSRKLEARIRQGGDAPTQLLFNVFQEIAIKSHPKLMEIVDSIKECGAREVFLSGSGPGLFIPIKDLETAGILKILLEHKYKISSFVVQTCEAGSVIK